MTEELYYIWNSRYEGNSMVFWRVDGHGYTTNLDEAWKLSKQEAERICRCRPKQDIALSASAVDELSNRHLHCEIWRGRSAEVDA